MRRRRGGEGKVWPEKMDQIERAAGRGCAQKTIFFFETVGGNDLRNLDFDV